MRSLVLACVLVACSKEPMRDHGAGSDGSANVVVETRDAQLALPAPTKPDEPLGPDGLPKLCADWKAAVDKLATCTALPQNVRDSLTAVYAQASVTWGQLPAAAKAKLATICKAGADSVVKGASATCGW